MGYNGHENGNYYNRVQSFEFLSLYHLCSILFGDMVPPIMENQMEKNMENEMEAGIIEGCHFHLLIVIFSFVRCRRWQMAS